MYISLADLDYVVIGRDVETSILLMVYGDESTEVKLRLERKWKADQACISVKLTCII